MKAIFCLLFPLIASAKPTVTVGSKPFTEGYILSEIVAQTIESAGEVSVQRKFGLGATGIIYEALKSGKIDIYPEYTGTISEAILKSPSLKSVDEINKALKADHLSVSASLGFDDTYALAIRKSFAAQNNIDKISDLQKFPDIRAGFTHEFLKRSDGFDALTKFYGLVFKNYKGMEHSLIFQSFSENKIDLLEVYSTDAKIAKYDLQVLKDDKEFFPKYLAVLIMREGIFNSYAKTLLALKDLEGKINEAKMTELNAKVELDGWSFEKAASYFLNGATTNLSERTGEKANFYRRTREHLSLVFISLAIAILVGIPLGVLATRVRGLGQVVLGLSGILQTIPSLALLCFLIPAMGIGYAPAVMALFLYALLPIVRSAYLGFREIEPQLLESAKTLGLSKLDRLLRIEFPLASPAILSGIKISAIINVGTATLAAFIGAGGYGNYIVTGLALNDTKVILQGAIPSAILALIVQGFFEAADRWIIPAGLRKG